MMSAGCEHIETRVCVWGEGQFKEKRTGEVGSKGGRERKGGGEQGEEAQEPKLLSTLDSLTL